MRNLKKSLSLVLALALLVSSVFVGGITASAALDLYTTINTYDDESDITLENVYSDTLQAPIINANDSWVYESFGSYGTSVVQDPLSSDANNVVHFGHIKSKTNSWPGAVRIYKQGTADAKTTFAPFAPKTSTTYEYEFRYYVKSTTVGVDFQIRNTTKRLHGGSEPNCYNVDRILTTAVSVPAGGSTDGWVTARGFFTVKDSVYYLGLFAASLTSAEDYNAEVYVDDIRISECASMTVYNYDGENDESVYASDYTTISDLSIPERDGYILTGIYADADLTTKINGLDKALDYVDTGVYYGWAKLNRGEYYVGFENYTMGINSGSFNSATTSIVSGNTYAGAYNIKVDAAAGSLNAFELRDKAALETKTGTKYVISFQYRATAAAKLYAGNAVASDVPGTATALSSGNLPAAADWTAASIEVTLNKGEKEGYVPALIVQATDAAVVEFDHIYLTYPIEETQNLTDGFVNSTDWYPALGEVTEEPEAPEVSAPWDGSVVAPTDADGDGVYEIDTAEKLAYVIKNSGTITLEDSTVVENGSFILTKDICLNDITKYDWMSDTVSYSVREWYGSGDVVNGFNGTIDGNFHTVYGLYSKYIYSCWTGNDGGRGLIPVVLTGQTATIKNLTIDYAHVDSEVNAAAFVGNAQGGTVILDSCVAGENIYITGYHATALVSGMHDGIVNIKNCASYATTEIENLAAGETLDYACYGLVSGYFVKKATVQNSFNANGPLVAGYTGGVKAENCYETEAGTVAGVTLLTKEEMQGKSVLKIDGTMPALNVGGNYWTATKKYPVLTASTGAEVVEIDVWDGTRVQPTNTDTDGYILITNAEELAWVVYSGNMTGKNYRFTNNIFLNDVNLIDWETGKAAAGYVPKPWYTDIRTTATADDAATAAIESTVIDGNGYTVYGMYYEDNSTVDTKTGDLGTTRYHNIGLFSRIASNVNITVNKLGIDCTYINHYAAASPFFGNVGENGGKNYITIDQCYVGEDVKVHGGSSGAFIGYVCGGSCRLTVSNSYVLGTVINGSNNVATSKFTGNTWGVSFYTTVTNPETSAEETEVYGYFNNYTVSAVIGSGWNSGIRTHGSYANNYGAGYTGFESDGVTPYYWWHTNRTTDNMQGLDVFTNANKMPNLNTNSVFTATEGYPVLTAFVGKAYVKPVVEEEEEEDTETGEGGETEEELTYTYWDGTSVAPTVGDGTEANPWQITTGAELYYVIANNGGAGVYYQLQNDIYLNDLSKINWQTGSIEYGYKVKTWKYGGSTAFQGNLDGNGYTVYGVYIHDGTIGPATAPTYSAGLISTIKGNTTVKNLGVDYSFFHHEATAGGFIGCVYGTDVVATISNCYVGENVNAEANLAGGFIGAVAGGGSVVIDHCYSLATSKGFIGSLYYNSKPKDVTISNCYYPGKFFTNMNYTGTRTVSNCYEGVKGSACTGVTTVAAENMKGENALSTMSGLKYFVATSADYKKANYNTFVYLPAGTMFDEDYKPMFFDNRMAPIAADEVMFTDRMIRGAYVKFGVQPDVTKIHVPVAKAHRVAFGSAQDLLAAGYYDLETEVISENLADQPDTAVNYIFITDPHFDTQGSNGRPITKNNSVKQFALAIKMANEMDEIDFICLGGDLANGSYGTTDAWVADLDTYLAPINECTKPVFVLVGNHDDNCYGSVADSVTLEQLNQRIMTNDKWQTAIIDKYINRTLADGTTIKVTQNEDPYMSEKINSKYFYYDLDNKNTRIICLNASDYEYTYDENGEFTLIHNTSTSVNVRSNTYNGYTFWGYSKYQLKWLAEEALGTLPEDYNVVVLSHMAITKSNSGTETYHNGTVLSDIMAAYQNKTAFAHEDYGISADFADDTGRIMSYQHGHEHTVYEKYNAGPDVWQFSSSTTNPHSGGLTDRIMNENAATLDIMSVTEGYVFKQALGQGDSGMFINNLPVYEGDINLDTIVDICDLVKSDNLELAALPAVPAANTTLEKIRKILIGA